LNDATSVYRTDKVSKLGNLGVEHKRASLPYFHVHIQSTLVISTSSGPNESVERSECRLYVYSYFNVEN